MLLVFISRLLCAFLCKLNIPRHCGRINCYFLVIPYAIQCLYTFVLRNCGWRCRISINDLFQLSAFKSVVIGSEAGRNEFTCYFSFGSFSKVDQSPLHCNVDTTFCIDSPND
ncbi:ATP-binding cassette sub-family A member [Trichinella spiralis]|uniref:ATP-binding cassette sub-family A member n=1 Tax=Trichinella spiralis TaxID=6334 RepID=A0ABR3KRQ9_TRISP